MALHTRELGTVKTTFEPPEIARWADSLAANESLDKVVGALTPLAQLLTRNPAVEAMLRGNFMGHALHPLLTDLPVGFWTSALTLDFIAPHKGAIASRRLTGLGIFAAVPTAVTGLVEWENSQLEDKRIGAVHAASNVTALAAFTASYLARRAGKTGWGRVLGLTGGAVLTVGGFLGGHLAVARKVGSHVPIVD